MVETRWKKWVFFYIPLTVFVIGTLFPFYWMLITAIRPDAEAVAVPGGGRTGDQVAGHPVEPGADAARFGLQHLARMRQHGAQRRQQRVLPRTVMHLRRVDRVMRREGREAIGLGADAHRAAVARAGILDLLTGLQPPGRRSRREATALAQHVPPKGLVDLAAQPLDADARVHAGRGLRHGDARALGGGSHGRGRGVTGPGQIRTLQGHGWPIVLGHGRSRLRTEPSVQRRLRGPGHPTG